MILIVVSVPPPGFQGISNFIDFVGYSSAAHEKLVALVKTNAVKVKIAKQKINLVKALYLLFMIYLLFDGLTVMASSF
jgi:hypothetical protein